MKIALCLALVAASIPAAHALPPDCNDQCDGKLELKCGNNGVTYTNSCFLNLASCFGNTIEWKADGWCPVLPQPEPKNMVKFNVNLCEGMSCPKTLPAVPVCGCDENSYGNECEMRLASCKSTGPPISVLAVGECLPGMFDPKHPVVCPSYKNQAGMCKDMVCNPTIAKSVVDNHGVSYHSECELRLASCQNPEKNIALAPN